MAATFNVQPFQHRNGEFTMNRIGFVFAWTAIVLIVSGCGAEGRNERHWTEDVLLEDGTSMQIERRVVFDETNALGGGTFNAIEKKSTLAFKGELSSLPSWDFPWAALVLYKSSQTGDFVIVGTTSSCDVWWRNGKPNPMYWQYDLINGVWTNVPLSQESIGKKTNLFYRYWGSDFPNHISIQERVRLQAVPTIASKYRQIVSEPPRCMDMK